MADASASRTTYGAVAGSAEEAPISKDPVDPPCPKQFKKRPCRKRPRFSHFERGRAPILKQNDDCVLFPELAVVPKQQTTPAFAEAPTAERDSLPLHLVLSPRKVSWTVLLARRETWGAARANGASGFWSSKSSSSPSSTTLTLFPGVASHRRAAALWQRQVLAAARCDDVRPKMRDERRLGGPQQPSSSSSFLCKFRESAIRRIPFTALGTPWTEAVVGLDRTGTYCLTLGDVELSTSSSTNAGLTTLELGNAGNRIGDRNETAQTCLALRMYGIPSPSRLLPKSAPSSCRSPLLMAIPLATRAENRRLGDTYEEFLSWTARIPIVLWMDSDWRMGVAWLNLSVRSHRPRHTLVVFPLPSQFPDAQQIGVRTLRRDDAAVHLHPSPGNLRKVLWSATVLPQTLPGATPEAPALVRIAQIQGHVLCLREDSHCFRLTWLCESSASARVIGDAADSEWDASAGSICLDASSSLVTFLRPGEWQDCHSHRYSGHLLGDHTAPPQFQPLREAGLRVASEARVRLSSILRDMLRRRPKLVAPPHSPDRLPLFSCDLVEVGHGGISLQVVICFDSGKHAIYAVFVEIHVMRQSYRELHWTRRDTRSTSEPLDTVAEILSANRRMSQQRLGPYRARPEPLQGWTGLCTARSVEPDEWTACHAPVVPDKVPWDALYPDAQVFDNRAVLLQAPVQSLRARSVPVELVYG